MVLPLCNVHSTRKKTKVPSESFQTGSGQNKDDILKIPT